jgi:hypothetical protein
LQWQRQKVRRGAEALPVDYWYDAEENNDEKNLS